MNIGGYMKKLLCLLCLSGFFAGSVSSNPELDDETRQNIYETAEKLLTCSSAVRNTWSVYETLKDEKTGKEIKIHEIANDLRIYSTALYKELNPQVTDEHLDNILGIRNTVFVTQLSQEERAEIVEECIELLGTLQNDQEKR